MIYLDIKYNFSIQSSLFLLFIFQLLNVFDSYFYCIMIRENMACQNFAFVDSLAVFFAA